MTPDDGIHEDLHHDDSAVDQVLMNLELMREDLEAAQALDRMTSLRLTRIDNRLQLLTQLAEHMKTSVSEDEKRIQRLRAIAAERDRR